MPCLLYLLIETINYIRECGCPAGAGGTREAAVAWWETPGAPESHQPPEHQHLLLVLVSPSGAQPIYTTWRLSSNSWGSTGSQALHISWQQLWGATQSAPCCPNLHEILAMPWQQNNKLLAPGLKSRKPARGAVARGQKTQEGGYWPGKMETRKRKGQNIGEMIMNSAKIRTIFWVELKTIMFVYFIKSSSWLIMEYIPYCCNSTFPI